MEEIRTNRRRGLPGVRDMIFNMFRCFSSNGSVSRNEPPGSASASPTQVTRVQDTNPKPDDFEPESLNPKPSNVDVRFSSYIDRARSRLRRMSSIGGGEKQQSPQGNDVGNDRFADFIRRAGRRLRTSSNVGREKE